jgi:hypothetical protein
MKLLQKLILVFGLKFVLMIIFCNFNTIADAIFCHIGYSDVVCLDFRGWIFKHPNFILVRNLIGGDVAVVGLDPFIPVQ